MAINSHGWVVDGAAEREFFCERARRELSYTFFPVEFVPGSTDNHFEPLSTKRRLLVATMTILCYDFQVLASWN